MRLSTFAIVAALSAAAASVGCAAIIGLDSGDPLPSDGGEDGGAAATDAEVDAPVTPPGPEGGPTPTCAPDTADCNGDSKDGCETKLNTPMHCSSCTDVCGIGKMCQGGMCCGGANAFCLHPSDCCTNKCNGTKCSDKP